MANAVVERQRNGQINHQRARPKTRPQSLEQFRDPCERHRQKDDVAGAHDLFVGRGFQSAATRRQAPRPFLRTLDLARSHQHRHPGDASRAATPRPS